MITVCGNQKNSQRSVSFVKTFHDSLQLISLEAVQALTFQEQLLT